MSYLFYKLSHFMKCEIKKNITKVKRKTKLKTEMKKKNCLLKYTIVNQYTKLKWQLSEKKVIQGISKWLVQTDTINRFH